MDPIELDSPLDLELKIPCPLICQRSKFVTGSKL